MSEFAEHKAVCQYIRFKYPKAIFFSDLSGIKMPIGLAVKIKSLKSCRGIPDLFIAEPKGNYHGLFIELKKEGEKIFKKGGYAPVSDHVAEQLEVLTRLSEGKGYCAKIINGYKEAIKLIDEYMNLKENEII